MNLDSALILLVLIALASYVIRSQRAIGNKVTESINLNKELLRKLSAHEKRVLKEVSKVRGQLNLLNTTIPGIGSDSLPYILSLTSHPARFSALEAMLPALGEQVLKPQRIILNIAHQDASALPLSIIEMDRHGIIHINYCDDLGPGKKLIPTLSTYPDLPIIVIDDDLVLSPLLMLQLMLEHRLYPHSIIASRVHRITYRHDGTMRPFSEWDKEVENDDGPSVNLLATSGAGTLFPPRVLHTDAVDIEKYRDLAFHTDDLWWYFQAQRIGTPVRRLPGHRPLQYIPGSQEDGLWSNGNQNRNEENLLKLIKEIGVHGGNK